MGAELIVSANRSLLEVVESFLKNFPSHNTRSAYGRDFREFAEFLRRRRKNIRHPREIQRLDVIEFRDYLMENSSAPTTVNRKISALSSLFSELQNAQLIEANPAEGVKRPKGIARRPGLGFRDDEVEKLLSLYAGTSDLDLQRRTMLCFLFYTGARVSEMVHVRVRDIDRRDHIPTICLYGKGNKVRSIPLHPRLHELLEEMIQKRARNEDDFIFSSTRAKDGNAPIHRDTVLKLVKDALKLAGLREGRSCHSSRRTLISNLLEGGERLDVVQRIAGHASPTTTLKYNVRDDHPENSPLLRLRYKKSRVDS